jgi:hypothetical protein
MARHPVLRPGDTVRLGGETHTVAALDGATVRLAGITGAVTEIPTARLLSDPGLELVTPSRVPMAPQPVLERLPEETVEQARWWERHLMEVITGVPPDSPPGTVPRPAYDPARRSSLKVRSGPATSASRPPPRSRNGLAAGVAGCRSRSA